MGLGQFDSINDYSISDIIRKGFTLLLKTPNFNQFVITNGFVTNTSLCYNSMSDHKPYLINLASRSTRDQRLPPGRQRGSSGLLHDGLELRHRHLNACRHIHHEHTHGSKSIF